MKESRQEEVRSLLAEVLDVDPAGVAEETHFINDLGVDSLMALEVMVALEKRFKVKIHEEELATISCLKNVVNLLEAKGVV